MKNEERIIELLAESLKRQDQMVEQFGVLNHQVKALNSQVENLNEQVTEIKQDIAKLNIQTASNTRAIIQMADKLEVVVDHEHRITKLEGIVLK